MRLRAVFLTFILMVFLLTSCDSGKQIKWEDGDHFSYQGNRYTAIDLSGDIFCCDAANLETAMKLSEEDEEEPMYLLDSAMEETLFYNGTLYCREEAKTGIMSYYQDDANFDWYVEFEDFDREQNPCYSIGLDAEELAYLYEMESLPKQDSAFLSDAQTIGSLIKISKDQNVRGSINILFWNDKWYWQMEIIDETKEEDGTWPNYIQPLPQSLSKKINTFVE